MKPARADASIMNGDQQTGCPRLHVDINLVAFTLLSLNERVGQLIVTKGLVGGIENNFSVEAHRDVDPMANIEHSMVRL